MANANVKGIAVQYELEDKQEKNVVVPRSAAEIQRFKLEKLLKKPVSSYVDDTHLACSGGIHSLVLQGDTKTYRARGPYRAIQGPQLLRDWSVMGDWAGGATSTGLQTTSD